MFAFLRLKTIFLSSQGITKNIHNNEKKEIFSVGNEFGTFC
jgi:hypothetical protein